MWRYLVPAGVLVVLIGFFFVSLGRDKQTLPSPLIGKPAPAFELPRVDDPTRSVSNREFAGKPYVLNIWGTWCPGCRQEHDVLLQIAKRGDVPMIGLNWKDEIEPAQGWLRELGNPYAVSAYDPEGNVGIDWGAYGAPETFLVDANGTVIYKHVSPMTMEIWEREFLPRLSQSGAAR